MKTYSEFRPTPFDHAGICLPDRQHWLVVPVSQTRDSGPFDESNFSVALEMLGGESDTVEVHRFGHWGPGWFEIIIVDPASPAAKIAEEIEASLKNYPLLSEEDHSKREYEAYLESWDAWGRRDYTKQLEKALADYLSELPEADAGALVEQIDNLETEEIDELADKSASLCNWTYQSDGDGISINIKSLVEHTDIDALESLCAESELAERKARDIKKLATICGATPEQACKAVAMGLVYVSQIRYLINS